MKISDLSRRWSQLLLPSWREALLRRFAGRQPMARDQLYRASWCDRGFLEHEVNEALDLIEFEFQLCPGLLRANDSLDLLATPPQTRQPLRWLHYQVVFGDRSSELSYQLDKRLRKHRTRRLWQRVLTVD